MIIARREGFSNDQWQIAGTNLLRVHFAEAGIFQFGSVADGDARSLRRESAGRSISAQGHPARYIRLCLADRCAALTIPDLTRGMTPVWKGPGSMLYRVDR